MKKLYLHIGTSKTGTTSIQQFLMRREKDLLENGILFPVTGRSHLGNHSPLVRDLLHASATESPPHLWGRCMNEIKSSDASTVIISGEMFYPLEKSFNVITGSLKSVFDEVRIVCYFRRQDQYLVANYTQGVKMGRVSSTFEEYKQGVLSGKKRRNYRYNMRLKKWVAAFGADNVIVRPFESSQLARGDVVADFCKVCELPLSFMPLKGKQQRTNTSPGAKVVQAMLYAHTLMPPLKKYPESKRQVALLVSLAEHLRETWEDVPFRGFSQHEARRFLRRFQEENRVLAQQFLQRESGHFFKPLPPPGDDDNNPVEMSLTDDERNYVAALVKRGLEQVMEAEKADLPLSEVVEFF